MRKQAIWVTLPICAAIVVAGAWLARAGDLNPPAGPVAPTMNTLSEIHTLAEAIHSAVLAGGGSSSCSGTLNDPLFAGLTLSGFAQDVYLYVEGIPGEVTAQGHEGWIDVLSLSQVLDASGGPGGGPLLGPVRVLAWVDWTLPQLLLKMATGAQIQSVKVELVHPATQNRYLRIELQGAVVSSVTPLFQARTYIVEFAYTQIQVTYWQLDGNGDPTGGGSVEFCWDVLTQNPC
jgi:type VI protein secretion system component Hcp